MDWNETEVFYDDSKSWQHRGLQDTEKWSTLSFLGNHHRRNNNNHNAPTADQKRRTMSQERQQRQQKGVYATAQADQTAATVLRVNCGGGAYTDEEDRRWSEDAYFTNGSSHSDWLMSWLAGLPDWLVFQTYRAENGLFLWLFPTGKTLLYKLPVSEGGFFEVKLHFSNRYFWFNRGQFDVHLQGFMALTSKDWENNSESSTQSVAVSLPAFVSKEDKQIVLEFIPNGREAYVSAIEVRSLGNNELPTAAPERNTDPAPVPSPTTNNNCRFFFNAGSEKSFQDAEGHLWLLDAPYVTTAATNTFASGKTIAQAAATLQPMYQTERYARAGAPLVYEIPVGSINAAVAVDVTLHMAELYVTQPGERVLSIYLEGSLEFENIDLVSVGGTGSNHVAITLTKRNIQVIDGSLSIEIKASVRDAKLNGISIVIDSTNCPDQPPVPTPASPPVAAPSPLGPTNNFETILINAGGDAAVDFLGRKWIADTYFTGGIAYGDLSKEIVSSQDDYLYQTERYGTFSYEIPVPPNELGWDLEIILHFAEIYFDAEGKRLFDIAMEGKPVFQSVDIVQLGEGKISKAVTLETPQTIVDGFVSISFTDAVPKVDNPKLSAIEIRQVKDHLAHAVADGPYSATDSDGDGMEVVEVNGKLSHT
jgi:hypothetical protein